MITECIIWQGALNSGGYPVTWHKGRAMYAHRLLAGAKSTEVVLHTCDNPACVNVGHLVIGTHADNSRDMVLKGRQATGEATGNSKYKEWQIHRVRELKGKLSSRVTASLFGMSKTNVLDIWNNKIWKKINE